MQAPAAPQKSSLTRALEELTTLLPKALEACSGSHDASQNLPVVEKLRSTVLDLLQGCLSCSTGGLGRGQHTPGGSKARTCFSS